MLVAPWRKDLPFTFGSNFGPWNFHDVRYAKPSQLAILPCACILVGEPPADEPNATHAPTTLPPRRPP